METLPITYRDYTIKQGEHTRYEYIHNEYDGPEDTRLGFCSTLQECMTEIDSNTIEILARDNDVMERRLKSQAERIQQLEATVAADARAMTQAHIVIGDYKKDVAELKTALETRDTAITILDGFVLEFMKTFEDRFESDEDAFNYEQMKNYVDAASYMARKNGTARYLIRRVLSKMNDMAA